MIDIFGSESSFSSGMRLINITAVVYNGNTCTFRKSSVNLLRCVLHLLSKGVKKGE